MLNVEPKYCHDCVHDRRYSCAKICYINCSQAMKGITSDDISILYLNKDHDCTEFKPIPIVKASLSAFIVYIFMVGFTLGMSVVIASVAFGWIS